jgi:hypothetical protein
MSKNTMLVLVAAVALYLWWRSRQGAVTPRTTPAGSVASGGTASPWPGVAAGAVGTVVDRLGGWLLPSDRPTPVDVNPNDININAD